MRPSLWLESALFVFFLLIRSSYSDLSTHTYEDKEQVVLFANKVGPYHNPQETYAFYSLPFCKPAGAPDKLPSLSDGLGSLLEGNELVDSGIKIMFKDPVPVNPDNQVETLCTIDFTEEVADELTHAVRNHYWYQLYLDDLPLWGMVGEMLSPNIQEGAVIDDSRQRDPAHDHDHSKEQAFLYTHKSFSVAYNGNRVIEVNLTSEMPTPIIEGSNAKLTYSVKWIPSLKEFHKRFDRYLDIKFFEHQIHWFSIFNSFMMVIFLCGLVSLILMRTLKNDYARYTNEDDDEMQLERVVDESGWKQVHGDVFRAPPRINMFSALVGTGCQLYALALCVILFAIGGTLYDSRGALYTACIVSYALTAFIGGYGSASYYKKNGGTNWKQVCGLTASFYPGACVVVGLFLNAIASSYGSSAAVGFGTIMGVFAIWGFIATPLMFVGTLVGRNTSEVGNFPCTVNTLRRPIPDSAWYMKPTVVGMFGGVLPFGSIFIEMYFVFTSFWNYKFYYVYGFMLLVFCILSIVTICVTIVSTYFLLNAEDYRWQWTALLSGGSTAVYVYLYAIYYFFTKTKMSGFMQTVFYFGYMGMFSLALFILCGTIGFVGTSVFVTRIYRNIKSD